MAYPCDETLQSFKNYVIEKHLIRSGRLMKKQIIRKYYIIVPFKDNYIY